MTLRKWMWIPLAAALLLSAGCKKKAPAPPPPYTPPPVVAAPKPPPAPVVVSFTANPGTIQRGESSTLRWVVENATEISIDNAIGPVPASGNRSVSPTTTTRYTLTARNAAGASAVSSVPVNVVTPAPPPPPPPPPAAPPKKSLAERLTGEVQDAFFDYDKSEIREDARATLQRNTEALKAILRDFPNAVIALEGHCDERGSAEYNLGLGDRRATAALEFLVQVGIPGNRLRTISYGKERPQCTDSNEDCWQRNRRVHLSAQ
jgi:peptidoglycan-associated lipoprotein